MARRVICALAGALFSQAFAAQSSAADNFYAGRQMTFIVGAGAGGAYDDYGRFIARFIGRHIPGDPRVVVRNMPGASSLVAANYVANAAPRDGTVLFMPVQTLPLRQVAGTPQARFDLTQFSWIGNLIDSANVTLAWHTAPVKTLADARKYSLTMGSTTSASLEGIYPVVMNAVLGTKFKVINGYDSGNEVDLALARGEIQGRAGVSWAGLKTNRPEWLRDHKITIFAQAGLKREPDLDVPLLTDFAQNDAQRKALAFYSSLNELERAVATTPGVPAARVAMLRNAFDAVMKDPRAIAEAKKEHLDLRPLSGVNLQNIINAMVRTDPKLLYLDKSFFAGPKHAHAAH